MICEDCHPYLDMFMNTGVLISPLGYVAKSKKTAWVFSVSAAERVITNHEL